MFMLNAYSVSNTVTPLFTCYDGITTGRCEAPNENKHLKRRITYKLSKYMQRML